MFRSFLQKIVQLRRFSERMVKGGNQKGTDGSSSTDGTESSWIEGASQNGNDGSTSGDGTGTDCEYVSQRRFPAEEFASSHTESDATKDPAKSKEDSASEPRIEVNTRLQEQTLDELSDPMVDWTRPLNHDFGAQLILLCHLRHGLQGQYIRMCIADN